jgi:hypothetical protein
VAKIWTEWQIRSNPRFANFNFSRSPARDFFLTSRVRTGNPRFANTDFLTSTSHALRHVTFLDGSSKVRVRVHPKLASQHVTVLSAVSLGLCSTMQAATEEDNDNDNDNDIPNTTTPTPYHHARGASTSTSSRKHTSCSCSHRLRRRNRHTLTQLLR